MMKKRVAAASLLAMCLISAANAQFIDERSKASPAAASAQVKMEAAVSTPKAGASSKDVYPYKADSSAMPFDVVEGDQLIREVLIRWAGSAGWKFSPEHWTIDRDLPVSGTADSNEFGADFKGAVRRLLESTELTDRPAQPCFYSNRVLRVVPKAEICDKTAAAATN